MMAAPMQKTPAPGPGGPSGIDAAFDEAPEAGPSAGADRDNEIRKQYKWKSIVHKGNMKILAFKREDGFHLRMYKYEFPLSNKNKVVWICQIYVTKPKPKKLHSGKLYLDKFQPSYEIAMRIADYLLDTKSARYLQGKVKLN